MSQNQQPNQNVKNDVLSLEQARDRLLGLLAEGRIMFRNQPLTGAELHELSMGVLVLYNGAKENQESRQAVKAEVPTKIAKKLSKAAGAE